MDQICDYSYSKHSLILAKTSASDNAAKNKENITHTHKSFWTLKMQTATMPLKITPQKHSQTH